MDYEPVLKCLKKLPGVAVQDIPYKTRNVIKNLPKFFAESCASDKEVDGLLMKLPQHLRDALLPFQLEGVKFGLRRHGRCLIADEMGLGKTLQVSILHESMQPLLFCMTIVHMNKVLLLKTRFWSLHNAEVWAHC
jgi:hypothetical protein